MTNDLWFGTSGPRDAPIVIVGESWGAEEEREKRPFVGSSGTELNRILATSGIEREKVLTTNVVAARPQGNQTFRFFEPRETFKGQRIRGLAPSALVSSEVSRLYTQIADSPRQVVIATGNYALWALSGCTGTEVIREQDGRPIPKDAQTWGPTGIMRWRGSMIYVEPHGAFMNGTTFPLDTKLLPIVHPAAIQRMWYMRDPTIHDLRARVPKALRGDWRPPVAPVYMAPPTFDQCIVVLRGWLERAKAQRFRLACDIETKRPLLVCIGFASSPLFAMSIPLVRVNDDKTFDSYWSPGEESYITHLLRLLLTHPNVAIDGQNFIYDTQYIHAELGVLPTLDHDTMLAQNVLFPGTPKGLDYLSSMYCDYHWYWKEDGKEWDSKHEGFEQLLRYNCEDCVRTYEVSESQRMLVDRLKMQDQMRLKMETHHLCLRMMTRGVRIDRAHRGRVSKELSEAAAALHSELLGIIPQEWIGPVGKRAKDKTPIYWYTSDKQTKQLFYDFLGFKVVSHPKTGKPTTNKQALKQFRMWYPEFTGLLNRLDLYGSIDNTLQVLRTPLELDGRMRCSYNPAGTETHRLSSSENAFGRGTNLQNLTKGEEDD